MTAPYSAIRSAFVTRLQAFPGLPSVAWENVPFTPATGVPYLQPSLLPGEPTQAEIGTAGANRHVGIYQISIFAPTGTGIGAINTLRDGLCDHFKRGTILTYAGITVTCQKAFPGPVIQETDWQHVPVSIRFMCDAPN
ncbi:MAG: phage tail terminator-like protein [Acidithiobacillus sp.]|nr:phage tail terminator-like protein [Acidithiobacillus sp.]